MPRHLRRPWRLFFYLLCMQWAVAPTLFAANDRGLIYRIGGNGNHVFLLGSVHMATADFYPLRTAIDKAFEQAAALVVEVDISAIDPQRTQAWLAANGLYPPGETLRDHLQPATWARLQNYLRQHQLDSELIARQKPGLVVVALSAGQMSDIGFSATLGIDEHFLEQAHKRNKPVLELETLEQQLNLLSELPNPDLLINQTLDEATELPSLMDDLTDAWKKGDAPALEKFLLADDLFKHPEYRPLFEQLYTERNRAMTAQIKNFLRSGKNYFVVVGAAHLVGRDGIVALLRSAGIEVEQQ